MTQGPNPEAAPLFTYFNVAIADADKAVAATAKRASVGRNTLAALANVDMPTSAAAFCLSSRGDRDPGCGDRPFL